MPLQEAQTVFESAEKVFDETQINTAMDQMAEAIRKDYADKNPIFLCVMNGGLFFTAELCKRLGFPLQLDYLHATRYNGDTRGSEVMWKAAPQADLTGRHVVVLDDILDEGHTLLSIKEALAKQAPASLKIAVLTEKQHQRRAEGIAADYIGLTLPDKYVFGCGMDYKGYYRNLSAIYAVQGQ